MKISAWTTGVLVSVLLCVSMASVSYADEAVNTYYLSGRLESVSWPDSNGGSFYHYLDEDWNGQGYGRVDRIKRPLLQQGDWLCNEITYYEGTDRKAIIKTYSDEWNTLMGTHILYDDDANRTESVTLSSPDTDGNIYYHYINENYMNMGHGRVDKRVLASPLQDGTRAYRYEIAEVDVPIPPREHRYSGADFTDCLGEYVYNLNTSGSWPVTAIYGSGWLLSSYLVDLGTEGLYSYKFTDDSWTRISEWDPLYAQNVGLGASGTIALIDFGASRGLWQYYNGSMTILSEWGPARVIGSAGPNSTAIDFGPAHGTWKFENGALTQLCAESAEYIFSYFEGPQSGAYIILGYFEELGFCRITEGGPIQISARRPGFVGGGDGYLLLDFGDDGLWKYASAGLSRLSDIGGVKSTCSMNSIDDASRDDLLIDFGQSGGIWKYSNNSLTKVSDRGGVKAWGGRGTALADFGESAGLWMYDDDVWTQLSEHSTYDKTSRPYGGLYYGYNSSYGYPNFSLNHDVIYLDFGPHGLYKYCAGNASQVHETFTQVSQFGDVANLWTNGEDAVIDFGSSKGIWKYFDGALSKISDLGGSNKYSLQSISNSHYYFDTLYLNTLTFDFGDSNGIWRYENGAWSKLSTYGNPENVFSVYSYTYFDFGSNGFWRLSDQDGVMTKLSDWDLRMNYDYSRMLDFGAKGLYKLDNGILTQINVDSPSFLNSSVFGDYDVYLRTKTTQEGTYEYDEFGNLVGFTATASEDLISDFGAEGLWKRCNDRWSQLTKANAESFMLSDKINDSYDVIGDFGSGGMWKYTDSQWSNLTMSHSESFLLSGIYGGGNYDVIGDFGSEGLWKYSESSWYMLTASNAKTFSVSGLFGDAYDVIGDFGSGGFWKYSGSTWKMLSGSAIESYVTTCMNYGSYDIVGDFGSGGFWKYSGDSWAQLSADNVEQYMLTDPLYPGFYDIIGDFGSGGLWKYSGDQWTNLTMSDAESFALSDLHNGSYDVIGDFGSGGLWKYSGDTWTMLTASNTKSFMLSETYIDSYDVIGDFGAGGIWKYSMGDWMMLTADSAESISLTYNDFDGGYDMVADFGSGKGVWKHSDDAWTQLTASAPDPEVTQKLDVLNTIGTPGQIASQGYTTSRTMFGGPSHRRIGSAIW